jgi:hypothetical protein
MSLIEEYARKIGAKEPINGSWLSAIAVIKKVDTTTSTDLLLDIVKSFGVTPSSGNLWQDLAVKQGAIEPVNGSWLKALIDIK